MNPLTWGYFYGFKAIAMGGWYGVSSSALIPAPIQQAVGGISYNSWNIDNIYKDKTRIKRQKEEQDILSFIKVFLSMKG